MTGSLYIYIYVKFRAFFIDFGKVEKVLRVDLPFPAPVDWEHTFLRERGVVIRAATKNLWGDDNVQILAARLPE